MSCEICKSSSCTRSFHSLSDQEDFDRENNPDHQQACVAALAGRDPAALPELERAADEAVASAAREGYDLKDKTNYAGALRAALARFRKEKA